MTELLMRDSDNASAIPTTGLAAVAGYGDGNAMWSSEDWARFNDPSIVKLSIVLDAGNVGDILDVENGAASPGDCPGWADRFHRPARRRPTIYCNRSTIDAVRRAMGSRPFDWWAATLDGTKNVPGAVAVQYCGAADSHDPCRTGGHYDESVILDASWIGQAAAPQPGPEVTDPALHWWGPYVDLDGQAADQVVELNGYCHAPVFEAGGTWYRGNTPVQPAVQGEYAQWVLANRIGGAWYVMDETGGPQGSGSQGRLAPADAWWTEDAHTDSSGCGGTNPPALALAGRGRWYSLATLPPPPPAPTPPPTPEPPPPPPAPEPPPEPVPPPPPEPDLSAARAALDAAAKGIADARSALGL